MSRQRVETVTREGARLEKQETPGPIRWPWSSLGVSGTALDLHRKVVASKLKTFVEVQSMSILSLVPRIEVHFVTLHSSRLRDQPVHQRASVTGASAVRQSDEIVNIQCAPPSQILK